MALYLRRICRDLPLYMALCALLVVDWLSQIDDTSFSYFGISSKKWHIRSAFSPHLMNPIDLYFIVDLAIMILLWRISTTWDL